MSDEAPPPAEGEAPEDGEPEPEPEPPFTLTVSVKVRRGRSAATARRAAANRRIFPFADSLFGTFQSRIVFAVLAAEAPASASDARERPPPPDGRRADTDRFVAPNLHTGSPRGADHRRRPRPWSPRHSRLPLRLTTARKNRRRRRRSSQRSCGSRFPVNRTTS